MPGLLDFTLAPLCWRYDAIVGCRREGEEGGVVG